MVTGEEIINEFKRREINFEVKETTYFMKGGKTEQNLLEPYFSKIKQKISDAIQPKNLELESGVDYNSEDLEASQLMVTTHYPSKIINNPKISFTYPIPFSEPVDVPIEFSLGFMKLDYSVESKDEELKMLGVGPLNYAINIGFKPYVSTDIWSWGLFTSVPDPEDVEKEKIEIIPSIFNNLGLKFDEEKEMGW
jgi:hypothetical protein